MFQDNGEASSISSFLPLPSAQNNAAEERKREKKPLYSTSSSLLLLLRFLPSAPYQSKSEEGGKGLFLTREKGGEEGCTKKAAAVGTELGIPPAKREKGGEPQLCQGRRRFAKGVGAEGKGGKRPRLAEKQKDKEERQTVAFRPFRRCLRCIKDRQKAWKKRQQRLHYVRSGRSAAFFFYLRRPPT